MALTDKLSAIGDAIREKTGSTELMTLDAMPIAIAGITTGGGGGGDLPEEAFTITGDGSYRFANNGWNWFLQSYGDSIKTEELYDIMYMFSSANEIEKIPFAINMQEADVAQSFQNTFYNCSNLKEIGPINNARPTNMTYMFFSCQRLRQLPEFNNFSNNHMIGMSYGGNMSNMFYGCYSLRSIPEKFLKQLYNSATSYFNSLGYNGFQYCYALDEIRGLRVSDTNLTNNFFQATFAYCSHLKSLVFDTQADGQPYVNKWSNQIIDLTTYVGYADGSYCFLDYNSGLKAEDEITSDSPILVKDDTLPRYHIIEGDDWWTTDVRFSRYNRESAIETFNSLPDCSSGSSNSIKLKKNQASGWCRPIYNGSIKTGSTSLSLSALTEEEIAIATAKGWTVSFVD